jgi:hypothetical protein
MSIDPRPVIKEIERHGGRLPAQLLSNLLGEVFRPERNQREPEIPPPLLGMAGGADELDYRRTNPPVGQPFNLIPSPPGAGTYCPLCFGGGRSTTSGPCPPCAGRSSTSSRSSSRFPRGDAHQHARLEPAGLRGPACQAQRRRRHRVHPRMRPHDIHPSVFVLNPLRGHSVVACSREFYLAENS